MFKILSKRRLNPTMTWLVIDAPLVAKKSQTGTVYHPAYR